MSQINTYSERINAEFPVAGQPNDTQVFRDNFDSIQRSLTIADTEITALETSSTRLDQTNDYGLNIQQNAVLLQVREQKFPADENIQTYTSGSNINWENGSYQTWIINSNVSMGFDRLPGDPSYTNEDIPIGMGRLTLELYGDGIQRNITFTTTAGAVLKKSIGTWDGTVTSTINPVILEVWRHDTTTIFLHYVGTFA